MVYIDGELSLRWRMLAAAAQVRAHKPSAHQPVSTGGEKVGNLGAAAQQLAREWQHAQHHIRASVIDKHDDAAEG